MSIAIGVLGHQTDGETFLVNFSVAGLMFLAGLSGVAAFFTEAIAIFRYKEKSEFVFYLRWLIYLFSFLYSVSFHFAIVRIPGDEDAVITKEGIKK